MAIISGYTSLQTAVTDYLSRSDLSSYVPNFIQNWEERFYRQPRNWATWMEDDLAVSISSGVATVPSDFLGIKTAYLDGQQTPPLKFVTLEQLYARYPRSSSAGLPLFFARNGVNFEFGPPAGTGYTLMGTYYAKPTAMRVYAGDAAAHWIIVNAPDLALYGSLLEAEPFIINDERIMVWKGFYDAAVAAYQAQHARARYDAPMVVAT